MSSEPNEPKVSQGLRLNQLSRERPTRVYKQPGGWMTSPGMLELFRSAEWEFLRVAELRGMKNLELTYVRLANVNGESRVYLYPTKKTDKDRVEVKRSGKRLRVNLGPDLTEWGLALPLHHRERFDLLFADAPESPVGPALYLDLAKPVEVKLVSGKETPAAQAAPGTAPAGTDGTQA